MDIYIDDDGYVCFWEGELFWTLHFQGWELFLPEEVFPVWTTGEYTVPTDEDRLFAQRLYEIKKENK